VCEKSYYHIRYLVNLGSLKEQGLLIQLLFCLKFSVIHLRCVSGYSIYKLAISGDGSTCCAAIYYPPKIKHIQVQLIEKLFLP
jgi:hypothetical protein